MQAVQQQLLQDIYSVEFMQVAWPAAGCSHVCKHVPQSSSFSILLGLTCWRSPASLPSAGFKRGASPNPSDPAAAAGGPAAGEPLRRSATPDTARDHGVYRCTALLTLCSAIAAVPNTSQPPCTRLHALPRSLLAQAPPSLPALTLYLSAHLTGCCCVS